MGDDFTKKTSSSTLASNFTDLRLNNQNKQACDIHKKTQNASSTTNDVFSPLLGAEQLAKNNISFLNQASHPQQQNALPTSPHPSSNSSVSSQAMNSDDNDLNNPNASSSSQPSSYNSSYSSNGGQKIINASNTSISALVPGGVVTTQNISTVIRPKSNNNSLQFVKIQTPELSKKAVEQIKLSESKEKVKEVEEEWQSNLLNWKSKRRQQLGSTADYDPRGSFESLDQNNTSRKTKTFAEILDQRAKSGNRLGFNLMRYIATDDEEEESQQNLNSTPNDDKNREQPVESTKIRNSKNDSDHNEDTEHDNSSQDQLDSIKEDSFRHDSRNINNNNSKNYSYNNNTYVNNVLSTNREDICDKRCDMETNSNSASQNGKQNSQNNLGFNNSINDNLKLINYHKPLLPTPILDKTRPLLPFVGNVDTVNSEVSTHRNYPDTSNSGSEEEDDDEEEEEEEQRQRQRIAFEAKLKAFENLTKPEMMITKPSPRRLMQEPQSAKNRANLTQLTSTPEFNNDISQVVPPPSLPPKLGVSNGGNYNSNISISSNNNDLQKTSTPKNMVSAKNLTQSPPPPPSSVKNENSNNNLVDSFDQSLGNSLSDSKSDLSPENNDRPKQASPIKHEPLSTSASNKQKKHSDNDLQSPELATDSHAIHEERQQQQRQQPLLNLQQQQGPAYNLDLLKQQALNRPPPTSMNCKLPNGKGPRPDNNRTVLSVSGRKRCSSCKEELGRGAAAFVVESLSLVYHTNCFRCSVCHVNLSNGFRGVDVRVHAGALHCQNCYSKDGLNYSRV